ncbi:MAG: DUF4397 domain-containing protein [Gemmatimonadaceae bacterium]|nr:DUF4397 domain-containing protein [Gemmatimonadaceae bacterium]
MIPSTRAPLALVSVLLLAACGRDMQTEKEVTTRTSAGDAATSISGDSADTRNQALVRVVNAVPNVIGLTVRSDEAHTLPSVDYKRVSSYQPIDRNWATFQVSGSPNGAYAPIDVNREMLTDGHRYTMVVMRESEGGGFSTRIFRDDIASDSTSAHVRVIHAAKGAGELDIVAPGGETIFDDVDYTSEAGFKSMAPWKGALQVRDGDGKSTLLTLPSLDLMAGGSYTIVITRDAGGKLASFWFEDRQQA